MRETALTREQILEAAEDVLRRYGPAKANVVDVARALGVSHGSVYRHFASKAALRDVVTERWLESISAPLEAIAREDGPAALRLQRSHACQRSCAALTTHHHPAGARTGLAGVPIQVRLGAKPSKSP